MGGERRGPTITIETKRFQFQAVQNDDKHLTRSS